MVSVLACPMMVVLVDIETEDALAISVKAHAELEVTVWLATTPAEEHEAEILPEAIVFLPSEPWVTVVVPEAILTEAFWLAEY